MFKQPNVDSKVCLFFLNNKSLLENRSSWILLSSKSQKSSFPTSSLHFYISHTI